jgi:predicted DNA-binding transcriptional regulator AlpA
MISSDQILSERELCNWLGISEPTLSRHRRDGTGPKFIRLSAKRVGYRRSTVEAWLRGREQQAHSIPEGAAAEAQSLNYGK